MQPQLINDYKLGLFTIPVVSLDHITFDIIDCLTTTPFKIEKRRKRLECVCLLRHVDPVAYMAQFNILEEKFIQISNADILDFINSSPPQGYEARMEINIDDEVDDSVKKAVEAALTSSLNWNLNLYRITCGIVKRIFKRIEKHQVFGPLCAENRIILIHKGGIAQRLSLIDAFPDRTDFIKEHFKLGGDNDVNIIIDPTTPNFDEVHHLLVDFVHVHMLDFANCFSCGSVNHNANKVTSIRVGDLDIDVKPAVRNNFSLSEQNGVQILEMDIMSNEVFVSRNETLKFKDEIGRLAHFTLLRFKKAFQVGNRVLGAEILDIAIPNRDEEKIMSHFHHYQSGKYTRHIKI